MTMLGPGAPLPGIFFWVRAILVLLYVGVPVLLVGTEVLWAARRARLDASAGLARRARVARLAGLAAGVMAGVLAIWLGQELLAPAGVAAGYLLGLLTGELLWVPAPTGPLRVAPLQTRYVRRYIPRWSVPVLLSAGVLAIAVPIVLTMLPTVRYGPFHPDALDAPQIILPGGALQWPAAACVPPAALAVLALAVGGIALRRVVLLPPIAVEQPGVDECARRNSARAVIAAVLAIELFVLGAQATLASNGVAVPGPVGGRPYLIWRILVWCGYGLPIVGVLVWCVLGWWKRLVVEPPAAAPAGPAAA
ncbi:MAG: hypothetical protein ACRDP7_42155 [Trebonia sp.]